MASGSILGRNQQRGGGGERKKERERERYVYLTVEGLRVLLLFVLYLSAFQFIERDI